MVVQIYHSTYAKKTVRDTLTGGPLADRPRTPSG